MSGASSTQALWFLTRGTGAVSLVLLTLVTVLGVANVARWAPEGTPRFVIQRVHRNASLVSVVFIAVHVATAVSDGFAPIRWIDAIVPFGSAYRPVWLGLGAVAFDLLVAVAATSLLRARLGYSTWRLVHWTAYGLWASAVVHGLGVGSDARQTWMVVLVIVSVCAVVAGAAWRASAGWSSWNLGRITMMVGGVAAPIALSVWFVAGPLQPGWAARAGTPEHLLGDALPATETAASVSSVVLPSQATAVGTTSLGPADGGSARAVISLLTQDAAPLDIRVVLNGRQSDEGFSVSNGTVALSPPRDTATYRGEMTGLSGGQLTATLDDGHGDRIELTMNLQVAASGQTAAQLAIRTLAVGSAGV